MAEHTRPLSPTEATPTTPARCPHCRRPFVPSTGEAFGEQHKAAMAAHVASCIAAVPSVTG